MPKNPNELKSEFNQLIIAATVSLERAVAIRRRLARINPNTRISYTAGPVGLAVAAAYNAVKAIKTFKGEFERNPEVRGAAAPANRR